MMNSEVHHRLINVLGITGSGKSALLKHTAHYLNTRRLISGGFIYINCRSVSDVEVFVKKFLDCMV